MEQWKDQGILLSARPHGEHGAIVTLLTERYGKHAGFLHGATSSRKRAIVQTGVCVDACWQARASEQLGTFTLEEGRGLPPHILQDALKLGALQAACALCEDALPEREVHAGLFHGLQALIATLESDVWGAAYVMWEIALLKELGFGLDFTRCAGGGSAQTLAYMSPKSGCAVSYEAGEAYKERLLPLPSFLKPNGGPLDEEEIFRGLRMTGYFLEHWVFAHHTKGVPEARLRFDARYAKSIAVLEETKQKIPA